jgi:hypothetical protein
MVKHIVIFDFKDENKTENLYKAKIMLEALLDAVPTLRSIEVGLNFSNEERAMDLSIITAFDDKEGLNLYANHPEHLEVVAFLKTVVNGSKVVDYIV